MKRYWDVREELPTVRLQPQPRRPIRVQWWWELTNQRPVELWMIYTNIQIYRPKRPWQLEKYTKRPLTANTIGSPAAAWVSPLPGGCSYIEIKLPTSSLDHHITCKEYFQDPEQSKPASSMQKLFMSNCPERVVSFSPLYLGGFKL